MKSFCDKNGKVYKLVEYDASGNILNKHILMGREYTRLSKNVFYDDYSERIKVEKCKIIFSEDCYMFHIRQDGEDYIKIFKEDTFTPATRIESKIYQHNNDMFEFYTVKQELLDKWLKKL